MILLMINSLSHTAYYLADDIKLHLHAISAKCLKVILSHRPVEFLNAAKIFTWVKYPKLSAVNVGL